MGRSPRATLSVAFFIVVLLLGSTAAPAVRVAVAAGGGGNASINLTKSIAGATVTPVIDFVRLMLALPPPPAATATRATGAAVEPTSRATTKNATDSRARGERPTANPPAHCAPVVADPGAIDTKVTDGPSMPVVIQTVVKDLSSG